MIKLFVVDNNNNHDNDDNDDDDGNNNIVVRKKNKFNKNKISLNQFSTTTATAIDF